MGAVARLLRSPRTIWRWGVDGIVTPVWLRLLGVRLGQRCRFHGMPIVTVGRGARIVLGNDVLINSRRDSNPAGIGHPTILAADAGASIVVGDGAGISGASIVARREVTIGRRVLIGAGACIWDTDFHPLDAEQRRAHATRAAATVAIRIADDAFVGGRAMILKGVTIGARAVIGAGAVVTGNVPEDVIMGGNPARPIRSLSSPQVRELVP